MIKKYNNFSELPNHIQNRIKRLKEPKAEEWVKKKIPALENKSVLETMSSKNGEEKFLAYIRRLEEYYL